MRNLGLREELIGDICDHFTRVARFNKVRAYRNFIINSFANNMGKFFKVFSLMGDAGFSKI